jgi:hypothetical protein
MERHHDPGADPEDEGIPDLQDGTPEQQRAEDPERMPVPGDVPVAAESFGTTTAEQQQGESLEYKLAQEEPEAAGAGTVSDEAAGRLVEPDEGARADTEKDMVGTAVGEDGGGLSAEEEAVRIDPEGRGGTW